VRAVPALQQQRLQPMLEVDRATVRFGGAVVVDDLTLSVAGGGVTALIGPNGAGKTTTFNVCSGLLRPESGSIRLQGRDITRVSPQGRAQLGLGRTFQLMQLCGSLSVRDNIALGIEAHQSGRHLRRHLWRTPAERRRIEEATGAALDLCELRACEHEPAATLSTGQRRLTELARVVAVGYPVVLLDEPSSGLDVHETMMFGAILQRLVEERNLTALIVEHDMALVMSVCRTIYVLDFGRLIFEGSPDEMQRSPAVRRAYLGEDP